MADINFGIINYGAGNLGNVKRALTHLDVNCEIIDTPRAIKNSQGLILPGVGSFAGGMKGLEERNLIHPIKSAVERGKPLLGICLGMQLLFSGSEEAPDYSGLNILPGESHLFPAEEVNKVPHMGWNKIEIKPNNYLGTGIDNPYFYFVHSYYIPLTKITKKFAAGTCEYDSLKFLAVLRWRNVTAIQPHPEKSGRTGLEFLKNYVEEVKNESNTSGGLAGW